MTSKISKLKKNSSTYIIAEIGFNHMGNYAVAKKMIIGAKKAGVDAVKFQTYIPEEMVFKNSIHFKLIKNTNLTSEQYKKLKSLSKKLKLDFFSTAFDDQSYQLLSKLGVDCLKIASMDLNNFYMFDNIKNFTKPLLLSTGMSNLKEIKNSYNFLKKNNKNVFLLHCISNYPTKNKNSKLGFLNELKKLSKWKIGFSDHTLGYEASCAATTLGAKIIEKHFTINTKIKGADNKDSLNINKMTEFVNKIRETEKMIKTFEDDNFRPDLKQKKNFRRFFFARKQINKNEKITRENLICLRSNKRKLLEVDNYLLILKKKTNKVIKKLAPIQLNDLR